jgi:hypothetical protein
MYTVRKSSRSRRTRLRYVVSSQVRKIKRSAKVIIVLTEIIPESQHRDVYRWLETTDPSPLHNRAWKVHEPHTSGWILRSPEWNQWLTGDTRCLWMHGIPGAGKTILTSFIVEQVKLHCKNRQQSGHSYYYCYFGHNQDEASPFLRWTIAQLCRQANCVSEFVHQLYKQGGQPSLTELMLALEITLQGFDIAYITIDALDESKPREDLLRVIRDLATDSRFSKIHCIVTSRTYIDIEQSLEPISHSMAMSNALVDEDIRKHVHSALHSETRFQRWPADILTEVEDALVRGSKGMYVLLGCHYLFSTAHAFRFRWAICQLDRLQRLKCDRHIIKSELAALPKTLDETYERIFTDIAPEEWPFARHALQWICFHQDIYEDNHALSMKILLAGTEISACSETHQETIFEYDSERLRFTLGSLVNVDEENMVFLAHYTVREYLESPRISDSAMRCFQIGQKTTTSLLMRIIFQEAREVQCPEDVEKICGTSNDLWNTPDAFLQDFTVYCTISSMMLMLTMSDAIASDNLLLSLVADFMNPSLDHYYDACRVCRCFQNTAYFFSEHDYIMELPTISTVSDNDEHVIFSHLLLLSSYQDVPVLAEAFSRGQDITVLAQGHVKFSLYVWIEEGFHLEDGVYDFNGQLLEVMAQLSPRFGDAFTWLLDQSNTATDSLLLSAINHHHIVSHSGTDGRSGCAIKKILDRGADPNGTRNSITPLQIAAAKRDVEGVRELLEAGADANATGDRNGLCFEAISVLGWCNELQSLSPLYICRNFRPPSNRLSKDTEKNMKLRIPLVEALLLQYGAEEYLSSH